MAFQLTNEKPKASQGAGYRRLLFFGGTVVALLLLVALFAPWLAPGDPMSIHLDSGFVTPGPGHWLGHDRLGRDILSQVIYGARVSMLVGIVVIAISLSLGLIVGGAAGFWGGILDEIFMRVVDIFLAFPGILLAIALAAVLGPSLKNVVIALSCLGWVGYARIIRGQFLSVRERGFVEAARAVGVGKLRIGLRHILPHCLAPVLVQASFGMGGVILAESSLSFLGLGSPGTPSWGLLLSEGAEFMRVAPHIAIFPGLAIMISVLAFNVLGDGVQGLLLKKSDLFLSRGAGKGGA
ncbi:MAG: ABC transporter permease [bacterium]|nr:ABC transporter permease [bacterium]